MAIDRLVTLQVHDEAAGRFTDLHLLLKSRFRLTLLAFELAVKGFRTCKVLQAVSKFICGEVQRDFHERHVSHCRLGFYAITIIVNFRDLKLALEHVMNLLLIAV